MSEENKEQIIKEEDMKNHYYWYFFYYNPDDSRVFVPKRCKWLGWTINFGNKKGMFFFGACIAALVSATVYCKKNDVKCSYSFSEICSIFKKDTAAVVEPVVSTVENVVATAEAAIH